MARSSRLVTFVFASAIAAFAGGGCALDGVNPGPGNGDGGVDVNGEADLVCSATLATSGSLTPPGTPPAADAGCIPTGEWTVNVTVADMGDCTDVPINAAYHFTVTELPDEAGYDYTWDDDPANMNVDMKITQGGPGDCEANFAMFSDDGTQYILLKPNERDLVLDGQGEYELWSKSQL